GAGATARGPRPTEAADEPLELSARGLSFAAHLEYEPFVGAHRVREDLAGAALLVAHGGVVLLRIVVEEDVLPHPRGLGDRAARVVGGVAPAYPRPAAREPVVFLGRVHRVVDEEIGALR